MAKRRVYRTTAMFRCVVTLKNGFHKTLRLTIDKVARLVTAVKQLRELPWLTKRYDDMFKEIGISSQDFAACTFINERTGEKLVSVAV